MKPSFVKISLIVIIATATLWQCIGAWQDSQTTDEAVHLISGLSYWQTGSFELNPEHPALFKLWTSWPLALLPNAKIPTNTETWQSGNQWTIGAQYLHYSPIQRLYGTHFLMLLGRLPMIMLWLGLVVVVAFWSWRNWGPWASLTATTFLAYDPNLLGHGHLVTNDVPLAFAYLGTFLLLRRTIHAPRWRNVFLLALVFSLAQLTKFSAVILWALVPMVMLIALYYRRPNWSWRWVWRTFLICAVMFLVTTWATYGWQITRIAQDPHITELWQVRQNLVDNNQLNTVPPIIQTIVRLADPATATGRLMERMQNASIPSYWYWRGFFSAQSHAISGHGAYLLGRASTMGWWYYFPVALLIKTPISLLLIVLIFSVFSVSNAVSRIRKHQQPIIPFDFWCLGFPPLAFLAVSMASHINIGVRHVFPTYVFWPLCAGALIAYLQSQHQRFTTFVVTSLVVVSVVIGTAAWPNTIGYFNGLIGGTKNGSTYLIDSNLDWGQDYWRLRSFLNRQQFPEVHISLFGSIPNNIIFPEQKAVLTDQKIQAGEQPTGIVCVSAYFLSVPDSEFLWLRSYSPTWRIGSSIYVYDFRALRQIVWWF